MSNQHYHKAGAAYVTKILEQHYLNVMADGHYFRFEIQPEHLVRLAAESSHGVAVLKDVFTNQLKG